MILVAVDTSHAQGSLVVAKAQNKIWTPLATREWEKKAMHSTKPPKEIFIKCDKMKGEEGREQWTINRCTESETTTEKFTIMYDNV